MLVQSHSPTQLPYAMVSSTKPDRLLTPLGTADGVAAAVIWKRSAFARGHHNHSDVKSERIERAIAEDVAYLAAHPVRRPNRQQLAARCFWTFATQSRLLRTSDARSG